MTEDRAVTAPESLRVLLVSPGYAPTPGGVEEHVTRLAEQLALAGHQVTVLTARRGLRRGLTEHRNGVQVHVQPAWRIRAVSTSPRLLLALRRHLADVDVVHVHSYHASTALALFWSGVRGRAVFTPHYHGGGHSAVGRALHLVYRRLAPAVFAGARAVICVSRAELALLRSAVPDLEAEQQVIPNGVATDEVVAAEPFTDQPPTVLSLGRLEAYKGVDRVIRAVAELDAPVQLVVVGDGSQADELRGLVGELAVDGRVRLLGATPTTDVHRWLRTAAVLATVSDHEAFGMAPLEAAAGGARVVLSDLPAYREIVDDHLGERAEIVNGHDVAAIGAAIGRALAVSDGGRLRTPADVPTWREIAATTVEVYRRVLAEPASADGVPSGVSGARTNGSRS